MELTELGWVASCRNRTVDKRKKDKAFGKHVRSVLKDRQK